MSGFFSDEVVKNEGAGDKWLKGSERDPALDEYFAGARPDILGIKYKNSPKAFLNSILNKLKSNYKKPGYEDGPGRAEKYEPVRRVSRRGKRFTPNEIDFRRAHKKRGIDPAVTAKILCRDVEEITGKSKTQVAHTKSLRTVAPTMDLIWAHRYIYFVYVKKGGMEKPLITDKAYDQLVSEEIEFGGGGPAFERIKNHKGWPKHIISLALYLCDVGGEK
jgi:hypothetical protein